MDSDKPGQSISEVYFIPRLNWENSCDRAQCLTHMAGRGTFCTLVTLHKTCGPEALLRDLASQQVNSLATG